MLSFSNNARNNFFIKIYKKKMAIYKKKTMENIIEQIDYFKIEVGQESYTIDVDKYRKKASKVYIYFRKGKDGYRFFESKIG